MQNYITDIRVEQPVVPQARPPKPRIIPRSLHTAPVDQVQLGRNGSVSAEDAQMVVYERAIEKLKAVVAEAREYLGLPEDAVIDTSNEATAGRIADFALGAFEAWRANHEELGDEEARSQFADFIGSAIEQGIQEASDILSALQALTPEVESNIDVIRDLVGQRLEDFVAGIS